MSDGQTYTLDEARKVLAKQECGAFGHDWEISTTKLGSEPRLLLCSRCGRSWSVHAPLTLDGKSVSYWRELERAAVVLLARLDRRDVRFEEQQERLARALQAGDEESGTQS